MADRIDSNQGQGAKRTSDILTILSDLASDVAGRVDSNQGQGVNEQELSVSDILTLLGDEGSQAHTERSLHREDYGRILGAIGSILGGNQAHTERSLHTGDYLRLAGTLGSIFG